MKILNVTPRNFYSCQMCGRDFETFEQDIVRFERPLCSRKCEFRLVYKILSKYGNSDLKVIWADAYPQMQPPITRTAVIFAITKFIFERGRK